MTKGISSRDGKAVREKLLDAAFEEFGEKGFEGTRLDDIAALAGTRKQAIFHHFGSKDGMFSATVKEAYRRLRAPDAAITKQLRSREPRKALHDLIEHLYKPSEVTVRFQRVMYDENSFKASHLKDMPEVKSFYDELLAILGDILERGQSSGVFRTDINPRQLYVFFAGILVYRITNAHTLSTMLGLSLGTENGARKSRKEAIDFVLSALKPVE